MKAIPRPGLFCLILSLLGPVTAIAQTKTVTLTATVAQSATYVCDSNAVLTVNSLLQNFLATASPIATFSFADGRQLSCSGGQTYSNHIVLTGVTNVTLAGSSVSPVASIMTFTLTTPTSQSGLPVNTVVIPSDAKGPVQIVLESSSDLVSWTSALPGTYGSTYTNRFFRVRAIAQQ
jgi:hypothetical protein